MGSFDKLFDFNHDGNVDSMERSTAFAFAMMAEEDEEEDKGPTWKDTDEEDDEWQEEDE